MKCKEIQEKDKINLQLLNKKKVQKLKEKGITLIALVVTIIILLILAGVTLNMALSGDGLFSKARNAADKYKKAQEDEANLISEIGKEMNSEYIGEKIIWNEFEKKEEENAYKVAASKSGAEEEQTFKTEDLGWRIWDYDGTTIRIISDKLTTQTLTLKGTAGYNNGVNIINEICRQCYGQYGADGKTKEEGISVSNLKRSDIDAVSNYDYTKYKNTGNKGDGYLEVLGESEDQSLLHYGESKTYETNFRCPKMWSEHDNTWSYRYDESAKKEMGNETIEIPWEQEYENDILTGEGVSSNTTEFIESYYYHDFRENRSEFKNPKYFDLIFKNSLGQYFGPLYYLATRTVFTMKDYCYFGFQSVGCWENFNRICGINAFSSERERCG